MYLNTEADLRDVPLGTRFLFFLHQDEKGEFTKVATMQDEFTMLAGHGFTYRVDEINLKDGKLGVTKQKLSETPPDKGKAELVVSDKTRVWRGETQYQADRSRGREYNLLIGLTGGIPNQPSRCSDIWVGIETHKFATEKLRQKHKAFIKFRGIPGWIDRVDGNKISVALFSGDRTSLQALLKDENILPQKLLKDHIRLHVAVSNDELRTYNPHVDNQASVLLEAKNAPEECYGFSGERWVMQPNLMLEGFRKGRIVRIFIEGWPIEDMPFGEVLL